MVLDGYHQLHHCCVSQALQGGGEEVEGDRAGRMIVLIYDENISFFEE